MHDSIRHNINICKHQHQHLTPFTASSLYALSLLGFFMLCLLRVAVAVVLYCTPSQLLCFSVADCATQCQCQTARLSTQYTPHKSNLSSISSYQRIEPCLRCQDDKSNLSSISLPSYQRIEPCLRCTSWLTVHCVHDR